MDINEVELMVEEKIKKLTKESKFAFRCNSRLAEIRIVRDIAYKYKDTDSIDVSVINFYINYITRNIKDMTCPSEIEKKIIDNIIDLELEDAKVTKGRIKDFVENENLVVRMLLPSYLEVKVKRGLSDKEKIKEVNKIISEMRDEEIVLSLSNFDTEHKNLQELLKENSFFDEDMLEVSAIYEKEEWDEGVVLPKSELYTELWEMYSKAEYNSIEQKLEDEAFERTRIVCDCGNEVDIEETFAGKLDYTMKKFNDQFSIEESEEPVLNVRQEVKDYLSENILGIVESHLECWFKEKYVSRSADEIRSMIENEHDNSLLYEEIEENLGNVEEDEEEYALDLFLETLISRINFSGASSWRDTCDEQQS